MGSTLALGGDGALHAVDQAVTLVIQKLDSYDGPFLEDGSDRDVSGVCAMVVKNAGSKAVEYAKITLTQGDRTLSFTVSGLRAGASTVAQESKAASYSKEKYNECTAEVAELSSFEMSSDAVKVTENEDGTLNVTNLTQQTIPCVRVFYKFCMTPGSIYVGGITYTAKLTDLAPGQTQQVTASPCTLDSNPLASRSARSIRIVTSEISNRALNSLTRTLPSRFKISRIFCFLSKISITETSLKNTYPDYTTPIGEKPELFCIFRRKEIKKENRAALYSHPLYAYLCCWSV